MGRRGLPVFVAVLSERTRRSEACFCERYHFFRIHMEERNGWLVPKTCNTEVLRLALHNAHPRDADIFFDEEPHLYYGVAFGFCSITTFIGTKFPKFISAQVLKRIFKDIDRNPEYQRFVYGSDGNKKSEAEIKAGILASWEANRVRASSLGTRMHRQIELFYNDRPPEHMTLEFMYFLNFHHRTQELGWVPLRTEMMVWDEECQLCGSVDMIYKDKDDNKVFGEEMIDVHVVDWKRSKSISKNGYGRCGIGLCSDLPDANFYKYGLQLNFYREILEKNYNVRVLSMRIVVMYPDNTDYQEYEVERSDLVQEMMKLRVQNLQEEGKTVKNDDSRRKRARSPCADGHNTSTPPVTKKAAPEKIPEAPRTAKATSDDQVPAFG